MPSDSIARRYGIHLVSLGVLLYATGPVLAKSATTSGVLLSFWRLWFGVAVFAVALLIHRLSGRTIGTPSGLLWSAAAGASFSLNQMLFFTAVHRTSVVDATLMGTLGPIVVAAIALPLFGERPGRTFQFWSAVAMAGAAFVAIGGSTGPSGDAVGMAMAAGSTFFFALFFLISKKSRDDVPVVSFLTVAMTTAAIVVSAYVLASGAHPLTVSNHDLWRALAVAVIPGALGHAVMTWPMRYVPANIPPLLKLVQPVIAGGLAWAFLGDGVTPVHLIGGIVIIGAQFAAVYSPAGQTLVAEARA